MSYTPYTTSPTDVLRQQSVMTQVYAWMTAGLLVTGAVAMFVAGQPALVRAIFGNSFFFFGLIIAQLAIVWGLSAAIGRISPGLATAIFLGYAILNGLTLSVIFLIYKLPSIASTFFVTAGTFGAMSLYGYTTKRDLSRLGSLLVMALIGLIIASIVNIFWANSTLYWIITYAGVLIFVGLTAWDTQKIKQLSMTATDDVSVGRIAILGALTLYLDFINLFLFLLRILGARRD
ncbi:MAG: Bax inhibitor-1/YccA family protein [Chloroflexales bacterium]|nr:Bax inhibitor-1/YccA family protein [Chloroflexales bacterium]